MHKILGAIMLCISIVFFSCKKETKEQTFPFGSVAGSINSHHAEVDSIDYEPTLKDALFNHTYDSTSFIGVTMPNGNTLTLKRYNTSSELSFYFYVAAESNSSNEIVNHAFVVSSHTITEPDLTSWTIETGEIYLYENGSLQQPGKLAARYDGDIFDIGTAYKNAIISPPTDVPVCVDWYWTTYDENGEILNQDFAFTTCDLITTGGGGFGTFGGGSTPPPPPIEVTEEIVDMFPNWELVPKTKVLKLTSYEHIRVKNYKVPSGQPPIPSIIVEAKHESELISGTGHYTWTRASYSFPYTTSNAVSHIVGQVTTSSDPVNVNSKCTFYP